nr:MAG TPA: hypothetical protein [Caudoviricetes sp.]
MGLETYTCKAHILFKKCIYFQKIEKKKRSTLCDKSIW